MTHPLSIFGDLNPEPVIGMKHLNWYSCGPTIYNRSHIGHGRTFITLDLMIRTMRTQLGYRITHLMNITDLDDKILHRLIHQKFLMWDETHHLAEKLGLVDKSPRDVTIKIQANPELVPGLEPVTMEEYKKFISEMDSYFWDDMKRLGMESPDMIQRVSDNIPHIIEYISRIEENGNAYRSNGSVYFDTHRMGLEKTATFRPSKAADEDHFTSLPGLKREKKHSEDFALWKKTKPFEIAFDSPWGPGRPGWHIECSAMIDRVFEEGDPKKKLHIHAGGIDLKFPHHHNETMQFLGRHPDEDSWVNWWIHVGHLRINETKMSQSLGNFLTIDEYLATQGTTEELRMMCLLTPWHKPMEFSDGLISNARDHLKMLREFLGYVDYVRMYGVDGKVEEDDQSIMADISHTQTEFQKLLQHHFQTNLAMKLVFDQIKRLNKHIDTPTMNPAHFLQFGGWLQHQLVNWGFISFDHTRKEEGDIRPLVDLVVELRDELRGVGKELKGFVKTHPELKPLMGRMYQLSDRVRDHDLRGLGIELQDRGDGKPPMWIRKKG